MQFKILRRQERPNEYATYVAALEWELTDPIVIEKREDLKSPDRWQNQIEPYQHQVRNLITFCRRLPVTLLADDVGLGKTISAGLIISELIARKRLSRILIVCPKLLGHQWQEELKTKFQLDSQIAIGTELKDSDPGESGATITTYNSARLHLDEVPKDRYQMLILDEAHKLRNLYGTQKPPQVALRFRTALEQRRFTFVLMLTATPIQNRLWDLYSLVDLLTAARGHLNPFGNEGQFVRKFIADSREEARQLKPESREEFRSIVYGYMSRVRRGDARLYFPERKVRMHKVIPTPIELQLIKIVGDGIQNLNRLVQISVLQALTSSPHAVSAQLQNMARNGTVPETFASAVKVMVSTMQTSAKLLGLGALVDRLARESTEKWRLVVFTGRRETQTTIQEFLERRGLKVGIINGSTGPRNQDTLTQFRKNPPECRVIVSTEAGSEGINLQVANVLVNYDLPWNPMIVEQRIGRVQRLASEHASVAIFNVILQDTFEEVIVGRLMEKLQMATQAIGDVESLLQASGMNGDDEGAEISFEEKIRALVVAALAGKDVKLATQQAEASIAEAKKTLEQQEATISQMLGSMDGVGTSGPKAPTLPAVVHSMGAKEFTLNAFTSLGATATLQNDGIFLVEGRDRRGYVRFNEDGNGSKRGTLYAPGTAEFFKLVGEIAVGGVHYVTDLDQDAAGVSEKCSDDWVTGFGGSFKRASIDRVRKKFTGTALVRVRATVVHDSYERLVEVGGLGSRNPKEGETNELSVKRCERGDEE